MRAFGIIADDLTGACDVGGAFAARDHRVLVDLCRGEVSELGEADVIVIDAGLRDAVAEDVQPAIERALGRLAAAGADLKMLKIDSTLRGPVGAMVGALMDMGGFRGAVVAPAFPEQGRLLVGGRLEVNGVSRGTDLAAMLEDRAAVVHLTSSEGVRDLLEAVGSDRHVVIVDAGAPRDLSTVADAWKEASPQVLLVGSAGLAGHVAEVLPQGLGPAPTPTTRNVGRSMDPWLLVVAGSPAEVTSRQLDQLAEETDCAVQVVAPGTGEVLVSTDRPRAGSSRTGQLPSVLLLRPASGTIRDQGQVATALASAARSLVFEAGDKTRGRPLGLVLVGGDTSDRVLTALGVGALEVRGEVAEGMPFSLLRGGPWDGVCVVTKAGGFGGNDALVSAVDFLAQRDTASRASSGPVAVPGRSA